MRNAILTSSIMLFDRYAYKRLFLLNRHKEKFIFLEFFNWEFAVLRKFGNNLFIRKANYQEAMFAQKHPISRHPAINLPGISISGVLIYFYVSLIFESFAP